MDAIPVEQAIYRRGGGGLVGRSPGFSDDWLPAVTQFAADFGERPVGVKCPAAVFAKPLGKEHVAVVQVADDPASTGSDPPLLFRVLVLPQKAYVTYLGDPFAVADRFPPPLTLPSPPAGGEGRVRGGELASLTLPAEPLPPRTIAQVREVLKRVKSHALPEDQDPEAYDDWEGVDPELAQSPALLGGVQVLVDGGKLVFERPGPDTHLMRGLWTLLPSGERASLWPASFAFDNGLHFDAVVVPKGTGTGYEGYTNEDQAAEYPQGSYELNLQIAAESGDQAALDKLLSRRGFAEMWRLALILLLVATGLVILSRLPIGGPDVPAAPAAPADRVERAATAASIVSCGDPWTAAVQLQAGHARWGKK